MTESGADKIRMKRSKIVSIPPALMILLIAVMACGLGQTFQPVLSTLLPQSPTQLGASPTAAVIRKDSTAVFMTATPRVTHIMRPANVAPVGYVIYDDVSDSTAADKRAPGGDNYSANQLERPFLQDMTYNANLDISSFTVGRDQDWYYVSIVLVGNDPNDKLGIDYGVELDVNHDGYGDALIWAHPPYPIAWDTAPVQIFQDKNHDTGGLPGSESGSSLTGDGYETLIFNGGGGDIDPDAAWVRVNAGMQGLVQFAFKRAWSQDDFMLGVIADGGLKDPGKMDYVVHMTQAEAGSPIVDSGYYPLKGLFAFDNVCRAAYGFQPTGNEPQLCPQGEPIPVRTPKPALPQFPPGICPVCPAGEDQTPYPYCTCSSPPPK